MKKFHVLTLCFVFGLVAIFGILTEYVPYAGADEISALNASSNLSRPLSNAVNNARYLVAFKKKPGPSEEKMIKGHGASILHRYQLAPVFSVRVPNAMAADAIAKNPNVDYMEEDWVVHALAEVTPWGIDEVNAPEAWNQSTGDGVNVCVIDTGIDSTHPDLVGVYAGGYDFVNGDPDPSDDAGHGTHCAGIIAAQPNTIGVIGVAYDVNIYACKVLNQDGYGNLSDILAAIEWAAGENNVGEDDNGLVMDIASLSLGGHQYSKAAEVIYQNAYDAGLLIVCASGNEGIKRISYPARYSCAIAVGAIDSNLQIADFSSTGKQQELVAPGVNIKSTVPEGTGFNSLVTQGTTDYEVQGMEYSEVTPPEGITDGLIYCGLGNTGDFPPQVEGNIALIERGDFYFSEKTSNAMAAGAVAVIIYNNEPGIFSGTMGEEVNEEGEPWIPVVSMSQEDGQALKALLSAQQITVTLVNAAGDYANWDGTSMACPHVSGVAALMFAANPALTNEDVRGILGDTADDLGDQGLDRIYGHGLVNAVSAVNAAFNY